MAETLSADGGNQHQAAVSLDDSQACGVEKQDVDVEKQDVEGCPAGNGTKAEQDASEETDSNIVDWDGPDDPANPQNWPESKKWSNIAVLAAINIFSPLASSMFAPGVPQAMAEFHSENQSMATFVVSVFVLGYVAGPLVLVPLSDIYGRVIIYHVGNAGFIVFTVACAVSSNLNMLVGFRFLAGMIGSAPMTVGGGTIGDMMAPAQRGKAITVWSMGVVAGPVIGPVAGGFLSQAEGWRWLFWVMAIATGVAALAGVAVMRESNPAVLLKWKAQRLRKATGNIALRSRLDQGLAPRGLIIRAVVRPAKLLFLSPTCGLMSLYFAFVYAILYLFFSTFTFVFEENYGFSQGIVGLVYVAMGIGMIAGMLCYGAISDRLIKHLAAKNGDDAAGPRPEYRLPATIFAAPFVPAGLFVYGWAAQYRVQWAVPLLGTLLTGFGLVVIMASVTNYLVDAFTVYAASALAANTVLRCLFAATFPLFALHMYDSLGLGWGNSLLGFISLAMCLIPVFFWYYGERIRTRFPVKL